MERPRRQVKTIQVKKSLVQPPVVGRMGHGPYEVQLTFMEGRQNVPKK